MARRKEQKKQERQELSAPRRWLARVFLLVFLIGLCFVLYPAVSNQFNNWRQSLLIQSYQEMVNEMGDDELAAYWEAARAYNETLGGVSIYTDVFEGEEPDLEDTDYYKVLNVDGNGVMGYISIPAINVKLAIYHGTSDDVLSVGAGHMSSSQLPIGGEGNHAVLAGHRGLPSAKLFTDLDKLEIGDEFYLYILDEVLAYEVDQILPMVPKDDGATLQAAMDPVEGEDYVTLFTCTPYGVNTHRLLVRGHRIPYDGGDGFTNTRSLLLQNLRNYYMLYLLLLVIVVLLVVIVARIISYRKRKRKKQFTVDSSA